MSEQNEWFQISGEEAAFYAAWADAIRKWWEEDEPELVSVVLEDGTTFYNFTVEA